jgi:2-hydroxychromene-2-carboxylate isomerase
MNDKSYYTTLLTTPPDKDKWINKERLRWATYFQVPISQTTPPNFPTNTLPIGRALAAISISHPQLLTRAISLFFENYWVNYTEPTQPEKLAQIVKEIVGSEEEAKKVLEASTSDEVKKQLTGNVEKAFAEGAFGLPWFTGEFISYAHTESNVRVLTMSI